MKNNNKHSSHSHHNHGDMNHSKHENVSTEEHRDHNKDQHHDHHAGHDHGGHSGHDHSGHSGHNHHHHGNFKELFLKSLPLGIINYGVCEKFCVSAPPDRLWADIFLKYTFITKIWKFRYL